MKHQHIMITGAMVATLLLAGCGGRDSSVDEDAVALAVRAQAAEAREFELRLAVQGAVECRVLANVSARVAGTLDAIFVEEGDVVVAGETVLFQIDPERLEQAVVIAEQNLEVLKASLQVAQASARMTQAQSDKAFLDYARYERLHEQKRVSDNEFETQAVRNAQAQASVEVAEANIALAERQVAQAESSLVIARKNLSDARVLAPISGVVSSRLAEPGEFMAAGQVVLRIEDLSTKEVVAFLPAAYHAQVQVGETAFRLMMNGKEAGRHLVTLKSPTVDPVLRTFEIKGAVGDDYDEVVPGNMAELTLVFASHENIGVPSEAVVFRGGKHLVFVVESGKSVARVIEKGLSNDGWTEVLSGLTSGDVVVYEGQAQLVDDVLVNVL